MPREVGAPADSDEDNWKPAAQRQEKPAPNPKMCLTAVHEARLAELEPSMRHPAPVDLQDTAARERAEAAQAIRKQGEFATFATHVLLHSPPNSSRYFE